jgi:hypothetical protein
VKNITHLKLAQLSVGEAIGRVAAPLSEIGHIYYAMKTMFVFIFRFYACGMGWSGLYTDSGYKKLALTGMLLVIFRTTIRMILWVFIL